MDENANIVTPKITIAEKALSVMENFGQQPGVIAYRIGQNPPSVRAALGKLLRQGKVERSPINGGYRLVDTPPGA